MDASNFKTKVCGSKAVETAVLMLNQWDFDKEAQVEVKLEAVGHVQDYCAVFWIWMRALAKSFSERGEANYADQEIHDIVCHKFLGYTQERTIGRTVVKPALRTITYPKKLNRSEFFNLLRELEQWASDNGVVLPQKPSLYEEDKARADN